MIQWVAAVNQALLYLLGQRLALHIPCRVKHLGAVVLRVAEFIQVNAQKHRRRNAVYQLFPCLDICDFVLSHRAGRIVIKCIFIRPRHSRRHTEEIRQHLHPFCNAQIDILLGGSIRADRAAVEAAVAGINDERGLSVPCRLHCTGFLLHAKAQHQRQCRRGANAAFQPSLHLRTSVSHKYAKKAELMRLLGRVQHSICTGFIQCADDNRLCRHAVQREGCGNTLPANRTAADRLRYRGRLQPDGFV